ncbi:MAG: undecaprenyl diphosphate synthase family protein [Candidatus Woesearchaeota archaeon]
MKNPIAFSKKEGFKIPKHIGVAFEEVSETKEDCELKKELVIKMLNQQQLLKIPMLSILLLSQEALSNEKTFEEELRNLEELLETILKKAQEQKIRISVFGNWHRLPDSTSELIKMVVKETMEYNDFFLNLCINYDSKEEIVDSFKLIMKRIMSGRLSIDMLDKSTIKENLYSSHIIEPELIIKTGLPKIPNFFVWDFVGAILYFTKTHWRNFRKKDFLSAIKFYNAYKK